MKNVGTVILHMLALGLITACHHDDNNNVLATGIYYQGVVGDGYGEPAVT